MSGRRVRVPLPSGRSAVSHAANVHSESGTQFAHGAVSTRGRAGGTGTTDWTYGRNGWHRVSYGDGTENECHRHDGERPVEW